MSTIGKQPRLSWLFLTIALSILALWLVNSTSAQEPGPLEAVCLTIASENPSIIPTGITAGEFCKVMTAVLASEWDARAKIQATILLVNNHEGRITVHHEKIAANQRAVAVNEAAIAELQATDPVPGLKQQIDAINAKLANMAAALQ